MPVTRKQLDADRAKLRDRWIAEGYFRSQTLSQALDAAIAARPGTLHRYYTENGYCDVDVAAMNRDAWLVARNLAARGLKRGDVVAVQMPMIPEVVVMLTAIAHLGAVVLPIVHTYGPAELSTILRNGKARALAMPSQWRGIDFAERLTRTTLPDTLEHLIVVGNGVDVSRTTIPFGDLLAPSPTAGPMPLADPQDDCLILFSSGTTGTPKGIRHSHESILAEYTIPFFAGDDAYLNVMPPGHIAALVVIFASIIKGVELVSIDRWDPAVAAEASERHRVGHAGGVPLMLIGLLEAAARDGRDLSRIRTYKMGGTAVMPYHIKIADEAGMRAGRFYGLSEHPTVSIPDLDAPFDDRSTTDGVLCQGTEVRIVDEEGQDLPVGYDGEIATRGPELFVGYTDPDLDLAHFLPGGWFLTGDIGHLDQNGAITITDRKKDLIIRGGENISPKELEDLLLDHPAISQIAVVGYPDTRLGERACAVVVVRPGQSIELADISMHLSQKGIAKLKFPERLEIVESMPLTANGKIRKDLLRDRLKDSRGVAYSTRISCDYPPYHQDTRGGMGS